ncbi:FeoA family protein [Paenibacillus aquistagni]|uniref:Ferrous iron transport protein A n=1 Tax=Paenibacillus aquistagni TaxID=1852522 RepID=A0A1X7I7V8_9BACL|nr:FeoA family protein [Paenibacillus aquistagni]NMM51687.1 ferrous iron transport protein A [Paenibacillus aquistagni]SMG10023.1 ferrous iron transport protein A [Paenibacillus aquistagni]
MASAETTLLEAGTGNQVRITRIEVQGVMRRRLLDLGFVPGNRIEVLQKSPLGDPIAFRVNNTTIALRSEESSQIWGERIGE